jgi:hypothetical protein
VVCVSIVFTVTNNNIEFISLHPVAVLIYDRSKFNISFCIDGATK